MLPHPIETATDNKMRKVGAIRKAIEPRRYREQRTSKTIHHEMRSHRNDAREAQFIVGEKAHADDANAKPCRTAK